MDFVQALYQGLVNPIEDFGYSENQEYKNLVMQSESLLADLMSGLTGKQQSMLNSILELNRKAEVMEQKRMFEYAFRLGAEMIMDIKKEPRE